MKTNSLLLIFLLVFFAWPPQTAAAYRVALFADPEMECWDAKVASSLERALSTGGASVTRLVSADLADPARFSTQSFDGLAWPCAAGYPVEVESNLLLFLGGGGDMILTGGRSFRTPYVLQDGRRMAIPPRQVQVKGIAKPLFLSPKKLTPMGLQLLADTGYEKELYQLKGAVALRPAQPAALKFPFPEMKGTFDGTSGIVWPILGASQMLPLLAAYDIYGRQVGWAASLMVDYAGKQKGSCVASFGISHGSFYQSEGFATVIRALLTAFQDAALPKHLQAEYFASTNATVTMTSPPLPRLRVEGNQFVDPKGKPVFLVGMNWAGSLGTFNGFPPEVEGDFARLHGAGIHVVRVMGSSWMSDRYTELCRRYGIYLIPELRADKDEAKAREVVAKASAWASKVEHVLGLDFCNEPYVWQLARLTNAAGETLESRFPTKGFNAYISNYVSPDWHPGFPSLTNGRFPTPREPELVALLSNNNAVLETWLGWCKEAARGAGWQGPVTVGYNSYGEWFEANDALDFASHHCYEIPVGYQAVWDNMTVNDRLAKRHPGKPATIGEFGYGDHELLADGSHETAEAAALAEIATYIYSYAQGHAGVFKWVLEDSMTRSFVNKMDFVKAKFEKNDEYYFKDPNYGMYYPDGAGGARPKPIVFALKFFSEYVAEQPARGRFVIGREDTPIGMRFTYRADGTVFLGGSKCAEPEASFETDRAHPGVLMLRRQGEGMTLMAASDLTVTVKPEGFGMKRGGKPWRLTGRHGGFNTETGALTLLQGERVRLEP